MDKPINKNKVIDDLLLLIAKKNKRIKKLETKNTLQKNALTWIVEETSSDIYNLSGIRQQAEQALKE